MNMIGWARIIRTNTSHNRKPEPRTKTSPAERIGCRDRRDVGTTGLGPIANQKKNHNTSPIPIGQE